MGGSPTLPAMDGDPKGQRRLSDETVALVLRRAAELESQRAAAQGGLSAADVEQVAIEAGISAEAVRYALAEVEHHDAPQAVQRDGTAVQRVEWVARQRLPERLRRHRRVQAQLDRLGAALGAREALRDLAQGWHGQQSIRGLVAVTDDRVLWVGGTSGQKVEDHPFAGIASVSTSADWWSDRIVIQGLAGKLDVWGVYPREAVERVGALVRSLAGGQPGPAPPSSEALDVLHRLGELRVQGVLTEEEFAAEKARVLRRD